MAAKQAVVGDCPSAATQNTAGLQCAIVKRGVLRCASCAASSCAHVLCHAVTMCCAMLCSCARPRCANVLCHAVSTLSCAVPRCKRCATLCPSCAPPHLECQQQQECLHAIETSVHKVSHEQVVGLKRVKGGGRGRGDDVQTQFGCKSPHSTFPHTHTRLGAKFSPSRPIFPSQTHHPRVNQSPADSLRPL